MSDDFDFDRVINDPDYRREVISHLNKFAADKSQSLAAGAQDSAASRSSDQGSERTL